MAGEIFISYRRADVAWARLLHSQLHAEGVQAWYDAQVEAGEDWRIATAKALEGSRIFVLLFSEHAAQSSDIAKELAAAVLENKLIVPIRLQNIAPKGAFLYELASRNWINAYENTEQRLEEVAKGLAHMVRTGKRDASALPFEPKDSGTASFRRKWPTIVAAVIAAAIAISTLFFMRPGRQDTAEPKTAQVVSTDAVPSQPNGVSIAVLPFLNFSQDKSQEFFSDGMTEEITSALAKIPGLTVIGRTSAFQFKGENRDLRAIGRALGARNLIEGSVRKDGDEVRITAQLIRVTDGTHLWTESYNRKMKGIFAVQEDIAAAIARAMQVPLGLQQSQNLVSNRTDDLGAYQQYLEARALFRARKIDEAITQLQSVVARDPKFAPAWALLAAAYVLPAQLDAVSDPYLAGSINVREARIRMDSIYGRSEQAAREAIRLDPRIAMGYHALANIESYRGHFVASEDYRRRALALDPNDSDILYGYAFSLAEVGRLREARRIQDRILAQEPFVPNYSRQAADVLWAIGENDDAIKAVEKINLDAGRNLILAKADATAGRYAKAAEALLAIPPSSRFPRESLENAAQLLRSAPAKSNPPDNFRSLGLVFVYLFVGADDRVLEFSERQMEINYYGGLFRLPWGPPSKNLRKTEHFKSYAQKSGFVDYWRKRGWPDSCHPVGADDFACN